MPLWLRCLLHCLACGRQQATAFYFQNHRLIEGLVVAQYATEEVQRVVEAIPGALFLVEGCVCTSATYGEAFRPITRFR